MKYAIVNDSIVTSIIIVHESQREEMASALSADLINADEYNLIIGDLWNGKNWTRNVDGEQVILKKTVSSEDRLAAVEAAVEMLYMEDVEV